FTPVFDLNTDPAQGQQSQQSQQPASYNIGDVFDDSCSLAGPPPDRSTSGLTMRMQCVNLPSQYQFADVSYADTSLQISSGAVVRVHGRVADISKSGGFGSLVVVVDADQITAEP